MDNHWSKIELFLDFRRKGNVQPCPALEDSPKFYWSCREERDAPRERGGGEGRKRERERKKKESKEARKRTVDADFNTFLIFMSYSKDDNIVWMMNGEQMFYYKLKVADYKTDKLNCWKISHKIKFPKMVGTVLQFCGFENKILWRPEDVPRALYTFSQGCP